MAATASYRSLVRCPSPSALPSKVKVGARCRAEAGASRREAGVGVGSTLVLLGIGSGLGLHMSMGVPLAGAEEAVEEYERETREVISRVRGTVEMEKGDPARSSAVAALREASNRWVAKYRRDKQLAGKPSFSNMYSVLNAISGHYISFGPTAPIPSKRKARILEEVDTAEKALSKGNMTLLPFWSHAIFQKASNHTF